MARAAELESENERLLREIESLESELRPSRRRRSELLASLSSWREELRSLEERETQLKAECETLSAEETDLRDELSDYEDAYLTLGESL